MLHSVREARRRAAMDVFFFEIAFRGGGDEGPTVVATDSEGRQERAPTGPALGKEQLKQWADGALSWPKRASAPVPGVFRDLTAPPEDTTSSQLTAEKVGRQLFDALFRGEVGRLYNEDVGRRGNSLSIALTFDLRDEVQVELFALPWECLHGGRDFLGLAARPIVRRLRPRGGEPREPLRLRRLRILAVRLNDTGLDLDAEVGLLQSVQKASHAFDLEICPEELSVTEVRRRLEEERFHVLHLMGHGHFSHSENAWGVELGGHFVTASDLARQLRSELSQVRMVVLNTCHSSRNRHPDTAEATRGLASALVDEGALVVVANGAPITDEAARRLSEGLYRRVGQGWPLPQAIATTRLDLEGKAAERAGVDPGEWAIPKLLLRAPGRVFIVQPKRWSAAALSSLAASLGGAACLLATAGVWLAHPVQLAIILLPLGWILGQMLWGWIRQRAPESHPLTDFADSAVIAPRRVALGAAVLLATGLSAWGLLGARRLEALPCLWERPDLDWSRSVLLDFSSDGAEAWGSQWRDDLESALEDRDLVPDDSPLGRRMPRQCFAWVIEGRQHRGPGGHPYTSVRALRRGREVGGIQEPGSPEELRELIHPWLQATVDGAATPLFEGLAPASRELNAKALDLYRRGSLRQAAEIYERAVGQDPDVAVLRNNFAQVLLDMARQESLEPGDRDRSRRREQTLLAKALRHLGTAIYRRPQSAVYRYHRGRAHHLLAERFGDSAHAAEADYRAALERRPLFPEAANDLAVLLLDRGGSKALREAAHRLARALSVVDAGDRSTRATILKNLGRARRAAGDLGGAWEALDQADCLAPSSRRDLRAEILGRAALLHRELLGPGSADVTWWRYGHFLTADRGVERRRAFVTWRLRHPHHPGRDRFKLWSLRCGLGSFTSP